MKEFKVVLQQVANILDIRFKNFDLTMAQELEGRLMTVINNYDYL